jgi:hypothetical protein
LLCPDKQSQKPEGLLLQLDPASLSSQLTSREIHLEFIEADDAATG